MAIRRWLRKLPAGSITPELLCKQVNTTILPRFNLGKAHISQRHAQRWLHFFGYQETKHKKGVYWDGHERDDVKAARVKYLEVLEEIQSKCTQWNEVEKVMIPVPPTLGAGEREHVILFHDECARHANERRTNYWLKANEQVLHKKEQGRLMMVSDFITTATPTGRLVMTEAQVAQQATLPEVERLPPNSRKVIYPSSRPGGDSYWNMDQMIAQLKETIKLGEYLLPNKTLVFIFDNSSAHNSLSADALNVKKMNLYPGGKVSDMHDTIIPSDNVHGYGGQIQRMQFPIDLPDDHKYKDFRGQPKGIVQILEERGFVTRLSPRKVVKADGTAVVGECERCKKEKARKPVNTVSMLLTWEDDEAEEEEEEEYDAGPQDDDCCLRRMLTLQSDFLNEKSLLYQASVSTQSPTSGAHCLQTITAAGHKCIFLPKFHCELNPIEYYWAWVKCYFRERCDGNFANAKKLFTEALDTCPGDAIRRFFRRASRYASVYRLGATGLLAEYAVKKFKSHRSVTQRDLTDAEAEKKRKDEKKISIHLH